MRVDVDISGIPAAVGEFNSIAARALDMRPAMVLIQEIIAEGHARQFESSGRAMGTPWAPNRPGTLARKARMGQGSEPMIGSGALRGSLTGGRGRRNRVTTSSVTVGTSLFYALFHITGTKRLPPRPPLGMGEPQVQASLTVMERYLVEGMTL